MSHSKKISVDLRGFHIFDDGDEESSSDDEDDSGKIKKKLKNRIKHAAKMSVDLSGYHIFGDNESSSEDEEENEEKKIKQPKHSKKVSIDLCGFDLFYDSESEEEPEEDDEPQNMAFKPKPPAEFAPNKESISQQATDNFKKAQKMYLQNDDDDDLKGFHLFDEYNSDDDDEEEVIKLHQMEKDQLAVLVRSLLVENAILKDASQRARGKLDAKKARLKHAEESKKNLISQVSQEMENMRQIIRNLVQANK